MSDWDFAQRKKLQKQVKGLLDQQSTRLQVKAPPVPATGPAFINPSLGVITGVTGGAAGPPSTYTYNVIDMGNGTSAGSIAPATGMRSSNIIYNPLFVGQFVLVGYYLSPDGLSQLEFIMTPELPQTGTC